MTDTLTYPHPYHGTRPMPSSLADAIQADHPCDEASCDVRAALGQGLDRVAAHLLTSATDELPAVHAYIDAHPAEGVAGAPWDEPQWDEWTAYHDEHGQECPACGAYNYPDDDGWYVPEQCGNCLHPLDD